MSPNQSERAPKGQKWEKIVIELKHQK
jgi:hypothetical protein